jgi:hypothetical protein
LISCLNLTVLNFMPTGFRCGKLHVIQTENFVKDIV